jgi:hypothetical protein
MKKHKPKKLGKNQYECAFCHEVFIKGRPDSVALAEFHDRHPDIPEDDTGIVCDFCFVKMEKWLEELGEYEERTIN